MVIEIATLRIDPARGEAFAAAVAQAEPLFRADAQCTGFALQRVVEEAGLYHLTIGWTSVQAHMDFRETENFQRWRGLASPFFVAPPSVVHTEDVLGTVSVA